MDFLSVIWLAVFPTHMGPECPGCGSHARRHRVTDCTRCRSEIVDSGPLVPASPPADVG